MKKLRPVVLHFVWLLLTAVAQGQMPAPTPRPLPGTDQQFWNETQFRVPVSKRLTLNFLQFARADEEVSFRSDTRTGLGLLLKLHKYYSIQPTYTYQYAHPGAGRKNYSHRLFVDNLFRFPAGKLSFPLRIRVERIVRHGNSDYWNFRLRPGFEVPVKWGKQRLTLYANNESFYDTRYQAWSRQRLIAGVSRKFSPIFTADFFYQQQFDNLARPGNTKVFGTTFRFQLMPEK